MPKMMKQSKAQRALNYTPVETNIYKTKNRYRVRVGEFSAYCNTLKQARVQKRLLRQSWFNEPLF